MSFDAKKDTRTTIPNVDGPMKSDIHQALEEDIRLAAVPRIIVIQHFDIMNFSFFRWLMTVEQRYLQVVDGDSNISWAAYNASQQTAQDSPPTIGAMLPLQVCCHDSPFHGCHQASSAETQS